jgi:tRNA pseudouridine38-40 synthase
MYLCFMRYKISLSYDGSAFCGWQIQPDAPSVQACLEKGLSTLLGAQTAVTGAGRTDTAVNAFRYVAHFETEEPVADCTELCRRLNAMLPSQVAVHSVEPADAEFHARFDAVRREYTYFLHRVKDPFVAGYSYFYGYPSLDFEAMNRAAAALIGKHDFSCFEKTGADSKTSVCTVFEAAWHPYEPSLNAICSGQDTPSGQYWYFRIAADRFLRNMVRAVVGTLLEIGRGKRDEGCIAEIVGPALDTAASAPGAGPEPAAKLSRHSEAASADPSAEAGMQTPAKVSRRSEADFADSSVRTWIQSPAKVSRRSLAGESVPGHALFLSAVFYPQD